MQTFLALASFSRRNSPQWRVINRFMISFRGIVREIDLFKILRLSLRQIRARALDAINKFAPDVSAEFRELLRCLNHETSSHRFLHPSKIGSHSLLSYYMENCDLPRYLDSFDDR